MVQYWQCNALFCPVAVIQLYGVGLQYANDAIFHIGADHIEQGRPGLPHAKIDGISTTASIMSS